MCSAPISWSSIRPFDGSREAGFEELCAQLARHHAKDAARFIRKGAPDAGLECLAIFEGERAWGWQAKYFLKSPGASQWSQMDHSVKTALGAHQNLVKYIFCLPIDLPDANVDGKTSALQRWNKRVGEWQKLAREKGMEVEFEYWGSHELAKLLMEPSHVGLVRYFFDVTLFSPSWFRSSVDEALHSAGARYTPELNVGLPITREFEAFGRSSQFLDRVKRLAIELRRKLRGLPRLDLEEIGLSAINEAATNLTLTTSLLLQGFSSFEPDWRSTLGEHKDGRFSVCVTREPPVMVRLGL